MMLLWILLMLQSSRWWLQLKSVFLKLVHTLASKLVLQVWFSTLASRTIDALSFFLLFLYDLRKWSARSYGISQWKSKGKDFLDSGRSGVLCSTVFQSASWIDLKNFVKCLIVPFVNCHSGYMRLALLWVASFIFHFCSVFTLFILTG